MCEEAFVKRAPVEATLVQSDQPKSFHGGWPSAERPETMCGEMLRLQTRSDNIIESFNEFSMRISLEGDRKDEGERN